MVLRMTWGDGTPMEAYSVTNSATNFSVYHYYEDDNPTNTPADLYTVSMSLSNNTGVVSTNVGVVIRNVAPDLALKVTSPIEIGAPATLRALNIREFVVPTADSVPEGITVGPDGNVWFTEAGANRLARITTNGNITEFSLGASGLTPRGIATGPDERLWFCASGSGQVGAMTTNGVVTLYTVPRAANEPFRYPEYITRRGAAMWYTDLSYRVSRVTTVGDFTQFQYPPGVNPFGIAVGADNNIWWTAYFSDTVNSLRPIDGATNMYMLAPLATPTLMTRGPDDAVWYTELQGGNISRITTNGIITTNFVGFTGPYGICVGSDGAIWFTEHRRGTNSIGRLTLDGQLSRYGLAIFSDVSQIVAGPDTGIWFTMGGRNRIGRIRPTTFGNVVLTGELNDPGSLDPHTLQINWGDGSAVELVSLAAGIESFSLAHTYSGLQPSYTVNVTASDDDTGVSQASIVVYVNPIRLKSPTRSQTGEVRVKGTGASGQTISIETSSDLRNWSPAGTVNSSSNGFEFVHPNAPGATRFYRGKLP